MSKNYVKEFLKDNGLNFDQWFKIEQYRDMHMSFKIDTNGRLECSDIGFFSTAELDGVLRNLLTGDWKIWFIGEQIADMLSIKVGLSYDIYSCDDTANQKAKITFKKGNCAVEFINLSNDNTYNQYTALGEIVLGKAVLK